MANQLANNMSSEDKDAMENMDMEKMISHVTQNVFKMMNGGGDDTEGGNPFASIFNATMGAMGKQESEVSEDPEPIGYPKTRDICFDLNVDLEDFYIGKKKKLNVRRKRIIEVDGKQKVVEEKKKIIIPIERGMKDEQSIRFRGEADQIPGYAPGDIIITLIENEHPVFQRDGDNLIVIKNINMYELYDITFDIKHLDSRIIRVHKGNSESLHTNDGLRKISGEGMPIFKSASDFGDLFIRFNLVIPKTIEPSKLNTFKQIVIEFHGINDDSWGCNYNDKVKCLEKLAKTHYIVHAHGNNHSEVQNNIPDVIELTYVNKNYFHSVPEPNKYCLPAINLDYPNSNRPEIYLNFHPFVNS